MEDNNQDKLDNVDYSMNFFGSKTFIVSATIVFIVAITANTSITSKIDNLIYSTLKSNPNCSVLLDDYEVKLFLPRVVLKNINIPNRCLQGSNSDLTIKEINIYFRGISFSPFGPHFKIETSLRNTPISAYLTLGMGAIQIRLSNQVVSLDSIKDLIPKVKIKGDLKIDGLVKLEQNKIRKLLLNLRSNNITLPPQKIVILNVPKIDINNLKIIANSNDGKQIILDDFILGGPNESVESSIRGSIDIDERSFNDSLLKLNGEFKIAESMIKALPFLKALLNGFNIKDGYYQLPIRGKLSEPKLSNKRN